MISSDKKLLGAFALSSICVGYTCTINNVTLGAQLGTHMTFSKGILTMLIGYLILTVITIANCLIGQIERTTGKEIWCYTFGSKGGQFPSIIVSLCMIIFAFFDFWYVGDVFATLMPNHPDIGFAIGMIFIVVCAMFGSIKGTQSLAWLTRLIIPFALAILTVVISNMIHMAGGMTNIFDYMPKESMSIQEGINIFLGGFMICVGLWPDITMEGRSKGTVVIGVAFGLLMFMFLFIFGQMGAVGMGVYGIAAIAFKLGSALFIATNIFVILAQATTIPSNTHMISTELHENFSRIPKRFFIIAQPLLAAFASFIIQNLADISILSVWAAMIGVLFAPIAGVTIADYWIVNKGSFAYEKELRPNYRGISFTTLTIGVLVGIYFTYFNTSLPATLTSLLITILLHSGISIIVKSTAKKIDLEA